MITFRRHATSRIGGVGEVDFNHSGTYTQMHIPNTISSVCSMPLAIYLTHTMANHCQLQLATAFIYVFRTQDLFINVSHYSEMFHIILRKGKYIGSNLKLSLNSVVESAKPNLVFIYQSSLGMLVRKLRSFLRCP